MHGVTIFEFGAVVPMGSGRGAADLVEIPAVAYDWLERRSLQSMEAGDAAWLKVIQRQGRRAVQVTSFVGVINLPGGFHVEVLPKVGKSIAGGTVGARQLLIEMLRCLHTFRHVRTDRAKLAATQMPLMEVFIAEFLQAVERVVKRGLRSAYVAKCGQMPALRGKLLMAEHLRTNFVRRDRFFTEHDEFTMDRPENRLLHAAVLRASALAATQVNQRLACELRLAFVDVAVPTDVTLDFTRIHLDRGMGQYAEALAWARLLLEGDSPLTSSGKNDAPSLLFPMEALFEAFVAKHLARQLASHLSLKTQARSQHLVTHMDKRWFQLRPDLLVRDGDHNVLALDTKWKLLDSKKDSGREKYGLTQSDFYQMLAYGQGYLDGRGDLVLIYPRTTALDQSLPVFEFQSRPGLRLWVVPFCLASRTLLVPAQAPFIGAFTRPIASSRETSALPASQESKVPNKCGR